MITIAKSTEQHAKAYDFDPSLFQTYTKFTLGALASS